MKCVCLLVLLVASFVDAEKSVKTSLHAQWNHTSFLAETSEFVAVDSSALFWTFLDRAADQVDAEKWSKRNHEYEYETAIRISSELLGGARTDLLKLALSLRLYSPRIQVHQQISEEYDTQCAAFVDLGGVVVCKANEVENLARNHKSNYGQPWLYSIDKLHKTNDESKPVAILYADVGSKSFIELHKVLRTLSNDGLVRYYMRHYAKRDLKAPAHYVGLSGYGVELAIKNTEYKAVDDSHKTVEDEKDDQDLHGLNFAALKAKNPHAVDSLKQLKAHLAETEELSPLKQWEVSDLSYQAVARIMEGQPEEALAQLVDIAQNFPLRSRMLVRTKVAPTLKNEVQENQAFLNENYNINEGEDALLVNGINIETDILDVFNLYETIRAESRLGMSFYDMGFRREYLSLLYNWRFGSDRTSYALDFRSANPEYLNNLDKDKMYKNWGNSVKALLQPTYMGMLRPIARNFYTLIFVVDLSLPQSRTLMSVGHSLYIHKVPIRIGYVFVTTEDKKASGMSDTTVALLNLYNFAKGDRNSAPKALDLMIKAMDYAEGDYTAEKIHQFFKKKFPDVMINDVFDTDSDYNEGRTAGRTFITRSGIGSAPKVMLNGVLLDDSTLTPDRIEEAILMQIMRQTTPLQRAVMSGKLTDKENVGNWILSQPDVLPRLNARLMKAPTKVIALDNVFPCKAKKLADFKLLDEAAKSQCIQEKLVYLTHTEEAKTRWLSVWLAADFETPAASKLLADALEALRKTDTMRLALVHTGAADSKRARFFKFVIATLSNTHAKDVLRKAAIDFKWLDAAVDDLTLLSEANKKIDSPTMKTKFDKFKDHRLNIDAEYAQSSLDLATGATAVVANGHVYGPLEAVETFDVDDLTLLAQLFKQRGVETISENIAEWNVDVGSGKSSDVVMRSVAALGKYATREDRARQYVSVPGEAESVVQLLASDPKRPVVDLTLVVNPLSKVAQKLAAIVASITRVVNCDLRIIFNPKSKLSELPLKRFYRFALSEEPNFDQAGNTALPDVTFSDLPNKQLLTLTLVPPDAWMVQSAEANYDLDNIQMQHVRTHVNAKFELVHLLLEGHTFDVVTGSPPRGLQFILGTSRQPDIYDTIVMGKCLNDSSIDCTSVCCLYHKSIEHLAANLGYFQLKASPGAWILQLREGKSRSIYEIHNHTNTESAQHEQSIRVLVDSFLGRTVRMRVGKRAGRENENLLAESGGQQDETATLLGLNDEDEEEGSIWSSLSNKLSGNSEKHEQINIFSLASGHLYERFMRIMILSVVKNTKHPVKFWLLNNYLSPQFRASLKKMVTQYKFQYELIEYRWPRWLHQQSEKQRTAWGYKILFLDVLFPLNVKKIIFVDADQVVRTDMMDLMNFDLNGAPYGFTPFCDSRTEMDGFRFWKQGYWASHLAGRKYHISALYVVDLVKFRQIAAGDRLRGQYQGLSSDPTLDLPNNMVHQLRIKSLPQEWLWCETWCSDAEKSKAKTIDLCNNPNTKEPKLESATRIIPEWRAYDDEIKALLAAFDTSTTPSDVGSGEPPSIRPPSKEKHGDEL